MKVVVIPEPVLQPDITKEDMDIRWKVLQDLPEVDELVIHHFDGYPSNEMLHPVIGDADAAIGIWVNGNNINEDFLSQHPNLKYVVPKEGANFWIDSLCIAANATNVDGAEKFINFVSDKESALRIADEIGYTTPNKEARLEQPEEVRNNPNAYMPKEIMDRCEIYVDLPKDVKKLYDNAWIQIKSSN